MPDDRFFHKRAGHSEKVNSLTDFEELIWRYYVLSADDFGVMKCSPDQLRADHERAACKPVKAVQRALDRIVAVALVHVFEHQGRHYIYSRNWQKFQKVDYPRDTINPMPPAVELSACEPETAKLFGFHHGGKVGREIRRLVADGLSINSARVRVLSEDSFDEYLRFTRAGALAKANGQGQGQGSEGGAGETAPTDPVRRVIDLHESLHRQFIGVGYIGNPQKDYQAACQLVQAFPEPGVQDAILAYGLNDPDQFMAKGTRTIPRIVSNASKYAEELRAKGLA